MKNLETAQSWIEHRLLKAWRDTFNRPALNKSETEFFEIGGSSLQFKILQQKIMDLLDYNLTPGQLFETPDVTSLANLIHSEQEKGGNNRLSHLINMSDQNREIPTYICHGVHGDTFESRFIASALGSNRYVYGIQDISGTETTQKCQHSTLESLGEHHAKALIERADDEFHIVGFSVGAWVAYSTAMALEEHGAKNVKIYLYEPSALPSIGSFFLSRKKLNQLGIDCISGRVCIYPIEPEAVDNTNGENKKLDSTYRKTIWYRPRPSGAQITLALRPSQANKIKNFYIATIAKNIPRITLLKGLREHRDFRLSMHAETLAQSIENAFKNNINTSQ